MMLLEAPAAPQTAPTGAWAAWTALAAAAQIGATWALLRSFDFANFAVGTAFSKTEPALAALFGAAVLAEAPSALSALGIAVGVLGVAALCLNPADLRRIDGRAAFWGIAAAAGFGLSAVGYRAGSLSLDSGSVLFRASLTLLLATAIQAASMGVWMRLARRSAWAAALRAWRPGLAIGAAGAAASAGWFTAMTLEPAAHVRALAQVELLFALASSVLIFGERLKGREALGVLLTGLGAALLLAGTR